MIQKRFGVLATRSTNNKIDLNEYFEGLSMIIAKDKQRKTPNI